MLKKKKVVKWYKPKVHSGWEKGQSNVQRRRLALKAHKKSYLSAGRSLLALANINSGKKGDKATYLKARADANYFFRMHKKTGR